MPAQKYYNIISIIHGKITFPLKNILYTGMNISGAQMQMRDQNRKMRWVNKFRPLIFLPAFVTAVNAQSLF